jgi:hypothetical protein
MSLKALFVLVPLVSFAAVGCKPSCTGLCDDAKDADCDTTDTVEVDGVDTYIPKNSFDHASCVAGCQRQEDMEDDDVDDCSDEFDALLDCANEQSDICKITEFDDFDSGGNVKYEKCNSETHDYAECIGDYCKDHQKRDYCN